MDDEDRSLIPDYTRRAQERGQLVQPRRAYGKGKLQALADQVRARRQARARAETEWQDARREQEPRSRTE